MEKKDYDVQNLTTIVTTIWEFQTELTSEECESLVEVAIENWTKFEFNGLIKEMTFGNRYNTCTQVFKLDLKHVHVLSYKSMCNIVPKLNERELLEQEENRTEKQNKRLEHLQNNKDQGHRIWLLEKTVAELESDKKEKELMYKKQTLKEDIKELDDKIVIED